MSVLVYSNWNTKCRGKNIINIWYLYVSIQFYYHSFRVKGAVLFLSWQNTEMIFIHCWLLLSTVNTVLSSQRPGRPCWWRLGKRKHQVPQPCLRLLSLKYPHHSATVPYFPCSSFCCQHCSRNSSCCPWCPSQVLALGGFWSPNTSFSSLEAFLNYSFCNLPLIPPLTSCLFYFDATQYCTTI